MFISCQSRASSTVGGNVWTEVLTGSAAMHATTSDGNIVFSDIVVSPDVSYRLYANGIYDSTGPMSVSTTPTRYTCSPSTLYLYWSDGTSVDDRVSNPGVRRRAAAPRFRGRRGAAARSARRRRRRGRGRCVPR
jgi:hypothetical protein